MLHPFHMLDRLPYQQVTRLRWAVPALVFVVAALLQVLLSVVGRSIEPAWYGIASLALYTLIGSVVLLLGLTWLIQAMGQRLHAEANLRQTADNLAQIQSQLDLLQDLGRQAAMADDPHEVLGLAVRVPEIVLGAGASAIVSLEPEHRRANLEVAWGLTPEAVSALRSSVDSGWASDACSHCRTLRASVLNTCPLLTPLVSAGCAGDIHGVVCTPLGRGDKRRAVMVGYIEVVPPTERIQLFNILATELSAALESVQLRSRRLAMLADAGNGASERRSLDEYLGHALDTLVRGWEVQAGAILLSEDRGEAWTLRAHQGFGADLTAPLFGRILSWVEQARTSGASPFWPSLEAGDQLAAAVVLPLVTEGELIGALVLGGTRANVLAQTQTPLLLALAHQLALSVRNIQLSAYLRDFAVLDERYRLSREMHDGLAQTLGAVGLELDRAMRLLGEGRVEAVQESLGHLRGAVGEAYADVRDTIDGLRSAAAAPDGLVGALRSHVADLSARSGLVVESSFPDNSPEIPAEVALQVLRIAQEALSNVRRHGQAQHAWVRLVIGEDSLELSIADDGCGFDPAAPRGRGHHGLATMRERARSIGGQLTLATSPGQGTRVLLRVPRQAL